MAATLQGRGASPYRSRQIFDLLAKNGGKLQPEDLLRIEKDVYSGFDRFLARQIVSAYEKRKPADPRFVTAIAMLRTWDGQMDEERPEPLIAALAFQHVRRAIAERASPGSGAGKPPCAKA